jgi:hypothetical protein
VFERVTVTFIPFHWTSVIFDGAMTSIRTVAFRSPVNKMALLTISAERTKYGPLTITASLLIAGIIVPVGNSGTQNV